MKKEEIIKVVDAHRALVDKAIAILEGAPYWCFVGEQEYAAVAYNENGVYLLWPEDEYSYDDSTIVEHTSPYFDPALLSMPEKELKAWKKEQLAKYEREYKEKVMREAEAKKKAKEENELAIYEALRLKYGK